MTRTNQMCKQVTLLIVLLSLIALSTNAFPLNRQQQQQQQQRDASLLSLRLNMADVGASSSSSGKGLSSLVDDMLAARRSSDKMQQQQQQQADHGKKKESPLYTTLQTSQDHQALLSAHADQVIVLKVSSPACKACAMVHERFRQMLMQHHHHRVHHQQQQQQDDNKEMGVVFADWIVSRHSLEYVTAQMQVTSTPTILLYAPAQNVVKQVPCGRLPWKQVQEQITTFVDTQGSRTTTTTAATATTATTTTSSHRHSRRQPLQVMRRALQWLLPTTP